MKQLSELQSLQGRDLDVAVAVHVFGWEWVEDSSVGGYFRVPPAQNPSGFGTEDAPPAWSADVGSAWQVVEHLRARGWIVRVQEMPDGYAFRAGAGLRPEENRELPVRAACMLYPTPVLTERTGREQGQVCELGDSAALAICRAALRAAAREQR